MKFASVMQSYNDKGYSLKDMRLQGIMVFVSVMVDWTFVLTNKTTTTPRRRRSHRRNWPLEC